MMRPAYTLGMLDAMVKSGAISPDYARGAASVLCKAADYTLWSDSPYQNFSESLDAWAAKRNVGPGAIDSDNWITGMKPKDAVGIVDSSRHFWDDAWGRARYNARWLWDSLLNWGRGKIFTGARDMSPYIDATRADAENRSRHAYLKRISTNPDATVSERNQLSPQVLALVSKYHQQGADARVLAAQSVRLPRYAMPAELGPGYYKTYVTPQYERAVSGKKTDPYDRAETGLPEPVARPDFTPPKYRNPLAGGRVRR